MSELIAGEVGSESKYVLKFEGGKLRAQFDYAGTQATAGTYLTFDADAVIDAITAAIPGSIDNAVGDLLKAALKNV